ncbi:TRAP transporter large permease [Aminobacter aminovorans]|uniref:TRAP transporter large permease protein n=1 Tax=Aminobacter aminovorans TaxID=83263 RepID=A0AAC8YWR2_AMIAI|nr:TRAP transporter large permease subunit [Aminobacter aminovorans]AMS45411.1 membrane protein [Aminobacter aminovorans]MBB3708891.1 tripartite ATP-independent transporter DctM subunit [Aminobacter aminovorans]
MSAIMVIVFLILMAVSVPIAHAMIGGSALALLLYDRPLAMIAQRLYTPSQMFPMLAIPFFILAGSLMMHGKFGEYLINIARLLVGKFPGGLGHVTIVGSVMFGGVSGSAVADASAMGNALIPVQVKDGYPPPFAAAINASASIIAVLIPPSIPLILYGLIANVSIVDLFVAGILPGLLLALALMGTLWIQARRLRLPTAPLVGGFRAFRGQIIFAIPALLMPVFIISTLRFGIATPTEVSVMAVAYALVIGLLVYRDVTPRLIWNACIDTGIMTGAVMIIIMASGALQWIMTVEHIPQNVAAWVIGSFSEPWMVIIALNLVMMAVGMFLDMPAAVLLVSPLLATIGHSIGLDPVQLGLMITLNLAIGLFTPPVGTTLFISAAIAKTGIPETTKALAPFYIASMIVLALISFVPALTIY